MIAHTAYQEYLLRCQAGVPAEVTLGSPRSRDCADLGVCRVQLENEVRSCTDCSAVATAYLRIDPPTGRLLIHILACSLSEEDRAFHFGDDYLTVDHSYQLSAAVRRAIGLPEGDYRISPGNYPILDDEDLLTVSVGLAQVSVRSLSPVIDGLRAA